LPTLLHSQPHQYQHDKNLNRHHRQARTTGFYLSFPATNCCGLSGEKSMPFATAIKSATQSSPKNIPNIFTGQLVVGKSYHRSPATIKIAVVGKAITRHHSWLAHACFSGLLVT
jgi:hypothetical protein